MVKRLLTRAISWPGLLVLATASVYVWQAWDPGGWYLPVAKAALVLLQWVHEWTVAFAQQFLPEYMANFIKNNPPDMHRAHGYLIVLLMFLFATVLGFVLWIAGRTVALLTGQKQHVQQPQPTPQPKAPSKSGGKRLFLWLGALIFGLWALTGGAIASGYGAVSKYATSIFDVGRHLMTITWKFAAIAAAVLFAIISYFGYGPVGQVINEQITYRLGCDESCQVRREREEERKEALREAKHQQALARAQGGSSKAQAAFQPLTQGLQVFSGGTQARPSASGRQLPPGATCNPCPSGFAHQGGPTPCWCTAIRR